MFLLHDRLIDISLSASFTSGQEHGGSPPPPKGDYPVYRTVPEAERFFDPQQTLLEYNARIENEKMRCAFEADPKNADRQFIDVNHPDERVLAGLPQRDGIDGLRRIWGGKALEDGQYVYPEGGIQSLALPPGNTGEMISDVNTRTWDLQNLPPSETLVKRSKTIDGGDQYVGGRDSQDPKRRTIFEFSNARKRTDGCSVHIS